MGKDQVLSPKGIESTAQFGGEDVPKLTDSQKAKLEKDLLEATSRLSKLHEKLAAAMDERQRQITEVEAEIVRLKAELKA